MIVQTLPAQVKAGKMIRPPLMTFPCVLDDAKYVCEYSSLSTRIPMNVPARRDIRKLVVVPWKRVMVMLYFPE